jgi:hypothetical protein
MHRSYRGRKRCSDLLALRKHAYRGLQPPVWSIVGIVGYYCLMGCVLNGLQIEPPPDAPQLPR